MPELEAYFNDSPDWLHTCGINKPGNRQCWYIKNELDIGFRVQSALNPNLEIEHSLDLEHFKPSTRQVP